MNIWIYQNLPFFWIKSPFYQSLSTSFLFPTFHLILALRYIYSIHPSEFIILNINNNYIILYIYTYHNTIMLYKKRKNISINKSHSIPSALTIWNIRIKWWFLKFLKARYPENHGFQYYISHGHPWLWWFATPFGTPFHLMN